MATHNGAAHLKEQIDSILQQKSANISLFIFDDFSTDITREIIAQYCASDSRIHLTAWDYPTGGAFQNFKAAVLHEDRRQFDYIAFADQDDIWMPHKIESQVRAIKSSNAAGCSSSVVAFFEDASLSESFINNVGVQQRYDHFFEGGGQGCTYLFTSQAFCRLRIAFTFLNDKDLESAVPHDWLLYALCRAAGDTWLVLNEPLVRYRQHRGNVMGARGGLQGAKHRFGMLKSGIFRKQRLAISTLVATVIPNSVPYLFLSSDITFLKRLIFVLQNAFLLRRFKIQSVFMALLFVFNLA